MRINKYIAEATGKSRRAADQIIAEGRVKVNNSLANQGSKIAGNDLVEMDGQILSLPIQTTTLMLNKPAGYVCSRVGQGSKTIYELLPEIYGSLKPVGRLDKESTGLLLLTDDGQLAYSLTHPKFAKLKVYEIILDQPLQTEHQGHIENRGVVLEDGLSKLKLEAIGTDRKRWQISMQEGRNRQIRRTFSMLGYNILSLHRISFGHYKLGNIKPVEYQRV